LAAQPFARGIPAREQGGRHADDGEQPGQCIEAPAEREAEAGEGEAGRGLLAHLGQRQQLRAIQHRRQDAGAAPVAEQQHRQQIEGCDQEQAIQRIQAHGETP
jgi:hypothetical protein